MSAARRAAATTSSPGAAVDHVRGRLGGREPPRTAVIMGSGLGGLADRFEDELRIPYADVPGWPTPRVEGHAGALVAGRLGGVPVLGLAGRSHLYEGHPAERLALPLRVLARLGVEALVVSNAAGAVNPRFTPGEFMLIADHLDLTWRSPLAGPVVEGEGRWTDMHACYDPALRGLARRAAAERGVRLHDGVYAAMLGPSYETPAEIEMLRRLGADAVGMSTVPEVIAARACGIRCLGISCLTNYAAGVSREPLRHEEVLETTARVAESFQELVVDVIGRRAAHREA